jgi:hypothetical protein
LAIAIADFKRVTNVALDFDKLAIGNWKLEMEIKSVSIPSRENATGA